MLRAASISSLLFFTACPDDDPPDGEWQIVHQDLPGALLSVWGTSATDVWTVGADARDGTGPLVLHYDGTSWTRVPSGLTSGGLWWVFGFEGGPIYMGGDGGVILRYEAGAFTTMTTPDTTTIFGIWGASPDEVWAVGGASDATGGVAWKLSGDAWVAEPSLPADVPTRAALWKVFGTSTDDVWFVGSNGVSLHYDGTAFLYGETGVGSSLFTVHSNGTRFAAVGGLGNGIIVEYEDNVWRNVTPSADAPSLSGVVLGEGDSGVAVGAYTAVYLRDGAGWHEQDLGPDFYLNENLHGVWADPSGGIWIAGGQTFAPPLVEGLLIHFGVHVPEGGL
jgi:hypothetical protein